MTAKPTYTDETYSHSHQAAACRNHAARSPQENPETYQVKRQSCPKTVAWRVRRSDPNGRTCVLFASVFASPPLEAG